MVQLLGRQLMLAPVSRRLLRPLLRPALRAMHFSLGVEGRLPNLARRRWYATKFTASQIQFAQAAFALPLGEDPEPHVRALQVAGQKIAQRKADEQDVLEQAQQAYETGDTKQAAELYTRLAKSSAGTRQAKFASHAADCWAKVGDYHQSKQCLAIVGDADHILLDSLESLALQCLQKGEFGQARSYFKQILEVAPDSEVAQHLRVQFQRVLLKKQQQLNEASRKLIDEEQRLFSLWRGQGEVNEESPV